MTPVRILYPLAIIAVLFAACKLQRAADEEGGESTAPPVVAVRIAPVRRGNLEDAVTVTGRLEVTRRQKVVSPVTGMLRSLPALEGTGVHEGDLLATVRPREAQTAIAGAEALLRNARSEADRKEAGAALDLAKATQNSVSVRAGFNGVIASRSVTEGELVTENQELLTLVDLATIMFVAEVPLQDAPRIRRGQAAALKFHSLPGYQFPAVVDAVYPQSDVASQTVGVRLHLRNQGEETRRLLKPLMMGNCRIVTGLRTGVLLIPRGALLRDDEKNTYSLVMVNSDSIARVIPVTVGVSDDSTAEVRGNGLAEGAAAVVEGNYALPDSTRVRW